MLAQRRRRWCSIEPPLVPIHLCTGLRHQGSIECGNSSLVTLFDLYYLSVCQLGESFADDGEASELFSKVRC